MERYSHYSFKQYDNKLFTVTEHYAPGKTYSFGVVWSRERCAVLDTGLGLFGDMRKYIEGFTGFEKAIYAVCTSGDAQSVGAVGLFDEAFVNGADLGMAAESVTPEKRIAVLNCLTDGAAVQDGAKRLNIVDNSRTPLCDYRDPRFLRTPDAFDHFHLGGVHIEGEDLPGYTPGSIVLSVHGDDTVNAMFCGKSLSPRVNYLHRLDRAGLENYRDRLKALISNAERYAAFPVKKVSTVYFFSADSQGEAFFIDVPKKILAGVEDILRGRTAADMPAAYDGKDIRIHFAGSAQLLYDPALL